MLFILRNSADIYRNKSSFMKRYVYYLLWTAHTELGYDNKSRMVKFNNNTRKTGADVNF